MVDFSQIKFEEIQPHGIFVISEINDIVSTQ